MTTVAIALMECSGNLLICRRRANQDHGGKWEFPGGKVEPGETPLAALERELEEELGIDSITAEEAVRYEYAYPGKSSVPAGVLPCAPVPWPGRRLAVRLLALGEARCPARIRLSGWRRADREGTRSRALFLGGSVPVTEFSLSGCSRHRRRTGSEPGGLAARYCVQVG